MYEGDDTPMARLNKLSWTEFAESDKQEAIIVVKPMTSLDEPSTYKLTLRT